MANWFVLLAGSFSSHVATWKSTRYHIHELQEALLDPSEAKFSLFFEKYQETRIGNIEDLKPPWKETSNYFATWKKILAYPINGKIGVFPK